MYDWYMKMYLTKDKYGILRILERITFFKGLALKNIKKYAQKNAQKKRNDYLFCCLSFYLNFFH
jgi:hypothetical protein